MSKDNQTRDQLLGEITRLREELAVYRSPGHQDPPVLDSAYKTPDPLSPNSSQFFLPDGKQSWKNYWAAPLAWLDNSPVCTKIVDLDFNLQYMSSSGVRDLKIEDITEYYGKPYPFPFYPDAFKNNMTKNLLKAKETGEVITQEAFVSNANGDILWYHSTLVPVKNKNSQVAYIMVVSMNITAQKQAEESVQLALDNMAVKTEMRTAELAKSEERFSLAMRGANDGLWDWNLETDEVYYSPRWKSMLGYEENELDSKLDTWATLVHPDDRDWVLEKVHNYLEDRSDSFEVEMRMYHKEGQEVFVLSRAFKVIRESDGKPIRLVGTHIDITERKIAESFDERNASILEMIAKGRPASNIYDAVALMYEERHPGMRCSMLELRDNKLIHGGAPSLPQEYCDAINGLENGPNVGSCGTSTYTGKRVLVENIETDPKWAEIKHVALPHGMRCCWSEPIKSSKGKVLGAFGMYYDHPALPNEDELADLESAARLAGIIMEREQREIELRQSELKYRTLVETTEEWIWAIDLRGIHTYTNPSIKNILGYEPGEIVGKPSIDLLHEEDRLKVEKAFPSFLKAKKGWSGWILRWRHKDGTYKYLESNASPMLNKSGEVKGFRGADRDITERLHMQEKLDISQQRLLLHREQSPVGIIEWNTNFEFLEWNPAAQRIFGFTEEEVSGSHITKKILPESARPEVDKVWEDLMKNRGGFYSLNENLTKDGRIILCEWHNTPLIDNNGNVIGVTSLVEDVTERQQIEDNLHQTRKMEAIDKLTGGIAHDFNNMLSVILGFSELLKDRLNKDDPKLLKYSDEILKAGERAKKLTSKLLEFSRNTPSDTEIVNINNSLVDMQHLLEKTLTARIKLEMSLGENIRSVRLDKARLEDAILNVSINAMHAMPDGGILKVSTKNTRLENSDIHNSDFTPGEYILITITDTGIGMDRQTIQKMFDPFFSTKGSKGTGLGMSQVYGFVQQSDGNIQVFSEPGHGTRIAIYLPVYQEPAEAVKNEGRADFIEIPSGHETILVVDDEVALLDLAEDILTTYGYKVLCAENGDQALAILNKRPVDLLLSDVIMPGINGYYLAAEAEKLYPKIKIQMVSGFSDSKEVNSSNNVLHQQRIQKPYSAEKLLLRIRKLLDKAE